MFEISNYIFFISILIIWFISNREKARFFNFSSPDERLRASFVIFCIGLLSFLYYLIWFKIFVDSLTLDDIHTLMNILYFSVFLFFVSIFYLISTLFVSPVDFVDTHTSDYNDYDDVYDNSNNQDNEHIIKTHTERKDKIERYDNNATSDNSIDMDWDFDDD